MNLIDQGSDLELKLLRNSELVNRCPDRVWLSLVQVSFDNHQVLSVRLHILVANVVYPLA